MVILTAKEYHHRKVKCMGRGRPMTLFRGSFNRKEPAPLMGYTQKRTDRARVELPACMQTVTSANQI